MGGGISHGVQFGLLGGAASPVLHKSPASRGRSKQLIVGLERGWIVVGMDLFRTYTWVHPVATVVPVAPVLWAHGPVMD